MGVKALVINTQSPAGLRGHSFFLRVGHYSLMSNFFEVKSKVSKFISVVPFVLYS